MFAKRRFVNYLSSAARTATPTVTTINTRGFNFLTVNIEKTASSATPAVTVKIQGYDQVLDDWYDLLASAAITDATANGIITMHVGNGVPTTANVAAGLPLPQSVRILPSHADADSLTYQVTYCLMQG
jgi:hypothetical protein